MFNLLAWLLFLKGKQSDATKGNYSKLNNKGTLELRNIGIASEYLPKKFIIKESIGVPFGTTVLREKDILVVFGKTRDILVYCND